MNIELFDHHPSSWVSLDMETTFLRLLPQAVALVKAAPLGPELHPGDPDYVEISLVDDSTISAVHKKFMNIPGATDVITFQHGEIMISLDTASKQAEEFGESPEKELFRYMVHGLLHLRGYLDYQPDDRATMFELQETIIERLWRK